MSHQQQQGGYFGQGISDAADSSLIGHGYGSLVAAPAEIQAAFAKNKPAAFFDSERGIYWNGERAFVYNADAAESNAQDGGAAHPHVNWSTATGIENETSTIRLGNGTEGDMREHAKVLSSVYILAAEPIATHS